MFIIINGNGNRLQYKYNDQIKKINRAKMRYMLKFQNT